MITRDSSLAAWLLCRARRASTFCVFCSAWRKPVSSRGSFSISATGFLPRACAGHCHLYGRSSLSTALGSPVSAALLEMHGFLGYAGWQWMFVLEALPALVLGVVVLFFLTDRPAKAKWLTDQERAAGKRHARRGAGTGGKTEPFQRMARASGYTRPGRWRWSISVPQPGCIRLASGPRKSFAVSVLPRWRLVS